MDEHGLDLYDTVMPVYILAKILGLAPFYLRGKRARREFIPNVSIIIVLRFIGVMASIVYVAFIIEEFKFLYDIRGVALRCELYLGAVLTSFMLVAAVTNRNMVITILKEIQNIDKKMRDFGIVISYKNARTFTYFQIISISLVFASKAILQPFNSFKTLIPIYNVFNIVDYINTITLFQYVDFLLLLRQRYIWLNRKLRALSIADNYEIGHTTQKNVHDILSLKREMAFNVFSNIHSELFDVARKVNNAYSLRLLLTVGMRVVMIATQILTTYKMIFNQSPKSAVTFLLIGIYLFLHTSKVFMIASISANTADKAKQTGNYLHMIKTCSPKLRTCINKFSLQILQQNLHFDAGGFFILDYTLLYNITAALTVYLIIFIQFDRLGNI